MPEKVGHIEREAEICSVPAPQSSVRDRKALSETIDAALKAQAFCEPERSLIVGIVCDSLFGPSPDEAA